EGVPAEERDRLGTEALAPLILPADDDAEPRVTVDGVDLVEPAVPDVEPALVRHDGEHLVAARIERADPGARARLRMRGGPYREGPPHVGIVQPGVALGRIGLLERAEVDLRPDQVGVAHRTGDRRSRASGGASRAAPRARNGRAAARSATQRLVSRTRSPLPKSGVDRRRWQGATTRNSWRYSEEEQRSQRRRDAPEFGDGLRVRDTSSGGEPRTARAGPSSRHARGSRHRVARREPGI